MEPPVPKRPPKRPTKKTSSKVTPFRRAGLLPSHSRFVDEYLVDLNATQAATRAGFSAKTAYSQGQRLLKNVEVAKAIERAMKAREKRTLITQDRVLRETAHLSFSNVMNYVVDGDGNVSLAEGAPTDALQAISSIKRRIRWEGRGEDVQRVVDVEIRLWDKPGPLKLAGRHVGLFPNEVKVGVEGEGLTHFLAVAAAQGLGNGSR